MQLYSNTLGALELKGEKTNLALISCSELFYGRQEGSCMAKELAALLQEESSAQMNSCVPASKLFPKKEFQLPQEELVQSETI